MANRTRPVSEATRLADWQTSVIGREIRIARHAAGKRLVDVARATGISASQASRIELGRSTGVVFRTLARLSASVGLKLWLRAVPAYRRLLDKPQLQLFAKLSQRSDAAWGWEAEVPMPIAGDLRAADAVGRIPGCTVLAELLTRLSDFQAQSRAAQLKQRDLKADRLILVLAATSTNRRALREAAEAARATFPLSTKTTLAALAAGRDPGGNGIVLL